MASKEAIKIKISDYCSGHSFEVLTKMRPGRKFWTMYIPGQGMIRFTETDIGWVNSRVHLCAEAL